MNEEWISAKDRLPEMGQRVRAHVIKELIYQGGADESSALWKYDGEGEHRLYSWCPLPNTVASRGDFRLIPDVDLD